MAYLTEPFPDDWYVRDSNGEKIQIYGLDDYLIDVTNFCTEYNNQKFNQASGQDCKNN